MLIAVNQTLLETENRLLRLVAEARTPRGEWIREPGEGEMWHLDDKSGYALSVWGENFGAKWIAEPIHVKGGKVVKGDAKDIDDAKEKALAALSRLLKPNAVSESETGRNKWVADRHGDWSKTTDEYTAHVWEDPDSESEYDSVSWTVDGSGKNRGKRAKGTGTDVEDAKDKAENAAYSWSKS